jgi:UDP-glucose 4-epimerase
MKILVTGGSGFIGSHLVDELVIKGHEVINIDNCSANNEKFYFNKLAANHKIDVCDFNAVQQISQGCDFVFHLAAESRLQQAIENPSRAVEVNVKGTLSVLEACKKNKIKGLLFSSTSSIYGLTDKLPITEINTEDCLNPYASTKYAAELLIRNYNQLYGVNSCIFRYFNVFGERAPAKGQYALVTGIFMRQKANKEPLTIVGDGTQKRDFIYVKDVVSANIMCMEQWENNPNLKNANVYNVSSGKETQILDLAKIISYNITNIEPRKGEAKNNLACNRKLQKAVGWSPSLSIEEWVAFYS